MSARAARGVVVVVLLLWAAIWVVRAWVADDAFVTFRVVDHAVHGLGLRWNVADRVQVYTHPLWMLVQLAGAAATGARPEQVAFAASLACTLGLLAVGFATLGRASLPVAVAWSLALLASRSVVDWTASGLENPLLFVLGALLVREAVAEPARVGRLGLVTALLALARPDTPLLAAPVLVVALRRSARSVGLRASLRALLPGAALVGAWGLFALAYYGTPVPNTVPAKLPVGVTASWLAAAGVRYLAASAMFDPVGALGVVAAVALIRRQTPEERALVAGSGIYLLRTVQVGGCYMLGRLVSLPVVVAWLVVALVVARRWTPPRPGLALALLVPLHALALLPGRDFPDAAHPAFRGAWMDTRRAEVRLGSWWTWRADPTPPPDHRLVQGAVRPVHVVGPTGAFARALPDGDHVIDAFGLGDPLVARLPGHMQPGVAGHFMRALPDGWVEAWAADDLDRIRDPAVRACAERVWRVSRGPLWTAQRWRTIAADLLRSGC